MMKIRRRTRVVAPLSDGESCHNLAAAKLRHIADSEKYMIMTSLRQLQTLISEAVA